MPKSRVVNGNEGLPAVESRQRTPAKVNRVLAFAIIRTCKKGKKKES